MDQNLISTDGELQFITSEFQIVKNMETITGVIANMVKDNGCYCKYGKR